MKKVSAFAVFKGRKEKEGTPQVIKAGNGSEKRGSLKKASSTPVISENGDKKLPDSASKKILKALKGGSLRGSLRGGQKDRPTILPEKTERNPYVAGSDGIKLTSMRSWSEVPDTLGAGKGSVTSIPNAVEQMKPHVQTQKTSSISSAPELPGTPPKPPPRNLRSATTSSRASGMTNGHSATVQSPRLQGKHRLTNGEATPSKRKKTDHHGNQSKVLGNNKLNNTEDIEKAASFEDDSQHIPYMYNSNLEAKRLFESLIHPVKPEKFFKELWERKPLLVKRHMNKYNDGWFSTAELDKILRKETIRFTENLDVVSYEHGKRNTHNPVGRAYAPVVWDYYQNGCSLRLLNPQTYSRNIWKLLSVLQEYFGCCVGANIYLTPPGTQGFAPHYDDIEAFILQLEGKKHWRLYSPRNDAETLPRFSSANFTDTDVGEPILEVVLEAGDLLYFPRGVIHQGKTANDAHSLHITVSCYQKNTWGDLFEKLVPCALQMALEEDVEFRKGLPRDYLNYMGVANSDVESSERKGFLRKIEHLMTRLITHAPVDAACDQMGKQALHDALPPVLTEAEKLCSVHGNNGEKWDAERKQVIGTVEIEPDTAIKVIRKGVLRLLTEDDQVRIYHCMENARIYHDVDSQYLEISAEAAPAVEFLIHSYPEYVSVDSLPMPTIDERLALATDLYEKGLLITGEPLNAVEDDSSSFDGLETMS